MIAFNRAKTIGVLVVGLMLTACGGSAPTATPVLPTPTPIRVIITPTARPTEGPVRDDDQVRGSASAYLTIVHYGDFAKPATPDIARSLLTIMTRYPADVRLVWRNLPDGQNPLSHLSAQAVEAAAAQGKFWEMHDQLLANQAAWIGLPLDQARAKIAELAALTGIPDLDAFRRALQEGTYATLVDAESREAHASGLVNAPALFYNKQQYVGEIDEFALEGFARLKLLERRQFAQQPAAQIDLDRNYTATLVTEKGEVIIELFVQAAPVAVNNFVYLARKGWYNDITFFLVTPELAQTGDPSDTGQGTAGYFIFEESDNGLIFDREGLVAMANRRGVANSASSQFFITFGPLPPEGYNGQYAIFGQVKQGMDILRKLTPRNPYDRLRFPNPTPGDRLLRVDITESTP